MMGVWCVCVCVCACVRVCVRACVCMCMYSKHGEMEGIASSGE